MINYQTPTEKITNTISISCYVASLFIAINKTKPDINISNNNAVYENIKTIVSYYVSHYGVLLIPIGIVIILYAIMIYYFAHFTASHIMARWNVKDIIYKIINIHSDITYHRPGIFGSWKSKQVTIENTKTKKALTINMYPENITELQIGMLVGLVKRPAEHNYEMDRYYLIPKELFNITHERYKYRKKLPVIKNELN